jgi:hypothetical protein
MLKNFFQQIILPYFSQWNQRFFINLFRYFVGCFLECFPISSSLVNSLLYSTKDEKKIELNNVNIHFLTGIAGIFIFIFLRWQFPQDGIIYHINPKIFIVINGILLNFFYYYFFQYKSLINHGLFIVSCFLSKELPLNLNNFFSVFLFTVKMYKLNYIIYFFNLITAKYKIFFGKTFKILSFIGIFFTLKFIGNYLNYHWFIIFLSLWKMTLFKISIKNLKYQSLLGLLLFFNTWHQESLLNFWDFFIPFILFIIDFTERYWEKSIPSINNFFKIFIIFIIFTTFNILNIMYPIMGFNYYIFSFLGLLTGFPLAFFIKKLIYGKKNQQEKNIISIKLSILMTIIFIIIFLNQFIYKKFFFQFSPIIAYFLMGFFNSWALIPGFSRMLMTFLMGFLLQIKIKNIILINYCLLFITSIGQWLIYGYKDKLSLKNILNHIKKKSYGLLLLFTYHKNLLRGFLLIILLIFWSYFLMKIFINQLDTIGFWLQSILLRIVLAFLFWNILKKNTINTEI